MKPLFLTSTRPKHKYKTEKFFSGYLRTRKVSKFVSGSSKQFSNYKKMLVMKKFFMWYYNIKSWRLFIKVFKLTFLQKRYTFRYLLSLYHLLEKNILVLLVRAKFSFNLIESLYYVRSKFIYINGFPVDLAFFSTKVGDIVEVFKWQFKYILKFMPLLFLVKKAGRFFYNYFCRIKDLFFISKFYYKSVKKYYRLILCYKAYYKIIFAKIIFLHNYLSSKSYKIAKYPKRTFLGFIQVHNIRSYFKKHFLSLKHAVRVRKTLFKIRFNLSRNYKKHLQIKKQVRRMFVLRCSALANFRSMKKIISFFNHSYAYLPTLYPIRVYKVYVNRQLNLLKKHLHSSYFRKKFRKKIYKPKRFVPHGSSKLSYNK
jgi:hypothetical protein